MAACNCRVKRYHSQSCLNSFRLNFQEAQSAGRLSRAMSLPPDSTELYQLLEELDQLCGRQFVPEVPLLEDFYILNGGTLKIYTA